MMDESNEISNYFEKIEQEVICCYEIANKARGKKLDPRDKVEIKLARNMAERVEGLIGVVAPNLVGSGVTDRIIELEKEYSPLDWRVALRIALEVAKEKFCKFENKTKAMEIGIRAGFAYQTGGIVAAPLEGFIELKIKKTRAGNEYFAPCYAGPIRGAGGTAAAFSLLIVDYVRTHLGYSKYDPSEKEINRTVTEIQDYHERVTNLQYFPSKEELVFLLKHIPIEVDGDPTEKIEVSNHKDLERVQTNRVRGGICLVLAEGLSQKAPKLWKRLSKWGKEMGFEWDFLGEFLKLQKKIKAKQTGGASSDKKQKLTPNYTFIADLVAGRPVLTHPMAVGGFRLRYGRSRLSGFSAAGVNPATMHILKKYVATGTQLKVERPGKAAAMTPCDSIHGPIVLLNDGSVVGIDKVSKAKEYIKDIKEVLFLGDILFNYGDFSENGHMLVPCGYNEEWWCRELEKVIIDKFGEIDVAKVSEECRLEKEVVERCLSLPLVVKPKFETAISFSKCLGVPLHPRYTFYWDLISMEQLVVLLEWLKKAKIVKELDDIVKVVFPLQDEPKRVLELIGLPHNVINNEFVVLKKSFAKSLLFSFAINSIDDVENVICGLDKEKGVLENISNICGVVIRDKAGTFIGARMGRPEKAKMRKLTGSPQVLFPVGEEGGRLRCFQAALKEGKIEAEFPVLKCEKCGKQSVYGVCEECGSENKQLYFCNTCGILEKDVCDHGECRSFMKQSIDIRNYYKHALKMCKMNISPELVKGVRGTSNKDHVPENLSKGLLRAKHEIYVNKDGTVRFDMSEVPVTHFIPNEIGTSVERLKELGYENDTYGDKLENPDQVVEIKPQDVIIPAADGALDEQSNKVLVRVAKFIDDLLVNIYGLEPYYNVKSKNDLVGHLVLALAPHISAGMVGRIIGFSNTQGFFTHPMFHAALRRDCFSHDTYLPFFIKGRWEIKKIGKVIENLNPVDVVDSFGTKEVKISGVKTLGSNSIVNVNNFTKHSPQKFVRIKTASGKLIETTDNHKHVVFDKRKRIILAHNLKLGDKLGLPFKIDVPTKDINEFDLIDLLSDQEWVMVRGVNKYFNIKKYAKNYFSKKDYDNYTRRDSYPIEFIVNLKRKGLIFSDNLYVSAKRDNVKIPAKIKISNEFLRLVGLYVAEGYSRGIDGRLYQVYIAAQEKEIRSFVKVNMRNIFGLVHTENKKDRVTYSSRILYHLFICILGCGSSAYEKRLPSLFLNLPKYRIGHMLSGYFEGDGSVSKSDNRVTFDTVSRGLLKDLDFVFAQLGIFIKNYEYKSLPGKKVREFYIDKGRDVPEFIVVKGIIQSIFVKRFFKYVGFISSRKQGVLNYLAKKNPRGIMQEHDDLFIYDKIVSLRVLPEKESYCLNVNGNEVVANSILTRQCDGDEASISMLMDAVLNFSRNYLPTTRGASTMDAPLVLTSKLIPAEVDDQAHGLDVVWKYPLELYDAALEYKNPWEVKVEQLNSRLNKPEQYEGLGFTHDVSSINVGVSCSAYKSLPSMDEKLAGQMAIAEQVRAVNTGDVARLVIEKHFLKDTRGNLRKFSQQQFRCVKCNSKFRRPPLVGRCTKCSGKIIFTISEGSVVKYLDKSINLAENYDVPAYIKQSLDLLKRRVESMFGRDKEKQSGLGEFV